MRRVLVSVVAVGVPLVVVAGLVVASRPASAHPAAPMRVAEDPCAGGEATPDDDHTTRTEGAPDTTPSPEGVPPPPPPPPPALAPAPERELTSADAEELAPADRPPPAGWRLMLSDLTILRVNPIGLETRVRLGMQKRLYRSDKAITRNNFVFVGTYPKLNPASAQLSLGGELQPASIFNLRVYGELQQFFGTFGYLQSFGSANANYSDHTLKDLIDDPAREPMAKRLLHASIQPLVQLKVGPLAVRSLFQLDYWSFDLRDNENLVYEPTFDTLLPNHGWTLAIDTDVLFTGRKNLAIGLRHTIVRPVYTSEHFVGQADQDAYAGDNAHQRLGLFAAYTLKDRGPSRFNKPTFILIASWYLSHRWRTGEPAMPPTGTTAEDYVSRAMPYLLLGFAFESDLLDVP